MHQALQGLGLAADYCDNDENSSGEDGGLEEDFFE